VEPQRQWQLTLRLGEGVEFQVPSAWPVNTIKKRNFYQTTMQAAALSA
jgi:hypothetical protein